jgi:hypothetical protein
LDGAEQNSRCCARAGVLTASHLTGVACDKQQQLLREAVSNTLP